MPHTPYHLEEEKNWPKIILITLAVIVVIAGVYLAVKTFSGKRGDNNVNSDTRPQEIIDMFAPDSVPGCESDFYNCDDFKTQAGAQWVYDYCVRDEVGDIHQLDNDGDGMVCEGL